MTDAELQHNAEATHRLRELVARLTGEDLRRPIGGGWTASMALAHLAFWDARHDAALRAYSATGVFPADAGYATEEAVNAGIATLAPLVDPGASGSLAVRSAEQIDAAVAALAPDRRAVILASADDYAVRRWRHREEHIAQIEAALR